MPLPACSGLLPFLRLVVPINELKPLWEQRQKAPTGPRAASQDIHFGGWITDLQCSSGLCISMRRLSGCHSQSQECCFRHPTQWMVYTRACSGWHAQLCMEPWAEALSPQEPRISSLNSPTWSSREFWPIKFHFSIYPVFRQRKWTLLKALLIEWVYRRHSTVWYNEEKGQV